MGLLTRLFDKIIGYEEPPIEPYVPPEFVPANYEFTEEDKSIIDSARHQLLADKERYENNQRNFTGYCLSTGTPYWTRTVMLPNGQYVMITEDNACRR